MNDVFTTWIAVVILELIHASVFSFSEMWQHVLLGWGTIRKIRLGKEGWYLLDRKPIAVVEIFVHETGEPTVIFD